MSVPYQYHTMLIIHIARKCTHVVGKCSSTLKVLCKADQQPLHKTQASQKVVLRITLNKLENIFLGRMVPHRTTFNSINLYK